MSAGAGKSTKSHDRKTDGRSDPADGNECDGFDLLVVADGARSKLRDLVGTRGVNRGYPWGAHWFIGTNDGVFPENELYQVVHGTRKLAGFLATGRDLDGGEPLVSLVLEYPDRG